MATSNLGTLAVYLTADTKGFNNALRSANQNLANFSSKMKLAVTGGLTAMAGGLTAVFYKSVKFNEEMTRSLAIMKGVNASMRKELEATAKTIATKSMFSSAELAQGYFYLFSAGKSVAQSQKLLGDVASFAQAGQFDLATATTLLADAQSALGLSSQNLKEDQKGLIRVSDVLVKANTIANANVMQFSQALTNDAAAAMRAFNVQLEEGVAILASYADQGLKGQEAGASLGRLLRLIIPAANENGQAFKNLGINVFNSEGNLRRISDVIADMEKAFDGMSVSQKAAALESLGFEKKIQGVIFPLIGASARIAEYEKQLRMAGGTTAEVANNQLNSLTASFKIFMANVTGAVSSSLGFGKGIEYLTGVLKDLTVRIQSIDTPTRNFVVRFAAATAATGTLLTALKLLHIQALVKAIFSLGALGFAAGKATAAFIAQTAAISATTGATFIHTAAVVLQTVAVGGLTAALASAKIALIAVGTTMGTLAIIAGVAFAAFKFGEWLGQLDFIKSRLEWIGDWFYNIKGLEAQSAEYDRQLEILKKMRAERIKNGTLIPGTPSAPQAPSVNLPEVKDTEVIRLQKELNDTIAKRKFDELSIDQQINSLMQSRASLMGTFISDTTREVDRLTAGKEILETTLKIKALEKERADKITSAKERFENALESFNFKNMKHEEKINFLLEKRAKLQNAILISDAAKAYELKTEVLGIDEQLQELQGSKFSSGIIKENQFAAAVEVGTVEAYRAELSGKNSAAEYGKKTADNTSQMVKEQKSLASALKPLGKLKIA